MAKGIQSVKNQYAGINAHLHSVLQNEGGWADFHTRHIGSLANSLMASLLPMGYITRVEDALQLRYFLDDDPAMPRADVSIWDVQPTRPAPSGDVALQLVEDVIALPDLYELEVDAKPYPAIAIYKQNQRNKIVAWLELLSPSNKLSSEGQEYRSKRKHLLDAGIVFIELDYLHQTPTTFKRFPNYATAKRRPEAHPYHIVVLDPRPSFEEGRATHRAFAVDDAIPPVQIPLSGDDVIEFDFGIPYRKTYEEALYGLQNLVDYAVLPMNFERYSLIDQTRIARRMAAVLAAAASGRDLETNIPLPIDESLGLDEAMEHIRRLNMELNPEPQN